MHKNMDKVYLNNLLLHNNKENGIKRQRSIFYSFVSQVTAILSPQRVQQKWN